MNGGDFFRPFWRRLVAVLAAAAWAVVEWVAGAQLWAMLATGVAAWGAWSFLLHYEEPRKDGEG